MLQILKKIFGIRPVTNFQRLMKEGATVIDVRSASEYKGGHIKNSINIPLNNLQSHLSKIKKDKPVIICCASGTRSASAKSLLKAVGFAEIYNGGSWVGLQHKLDQIS